MTAFESNMQVLKANYPELHQRLITFPGSSRPLQALDAKSGQKTLRVTEMEYGREQKIFLHSTFDPIREAKRYAAEQMRDQEADNILYGFGLGYHVQEMAKLLVGSNRLQIFDTSLDIFHLALQLRDIRDVLGNPQIELHISDDLGQVGSDFARLLEGQNPAKFIIHVPSLKAIPRQLEEFKYLIQEINLRKSISLEYLETLNANYLVNRELVTHNVGVFFDKFIGVPVIIVCAGPSLDKNKHLLKELEDKALIICVGHALKSVLKIGVRPHFIITIDPHPMVYKQIEGLEELDIPFILMATAASANAENYQGPKFMACQSKAYLGAYPPSYLVKTGGSVSTTALDIAIRMGGNPIIFIGQDLAFSRDRHHCQDSFHEDVSVKPLDTMRRVKGWQGEEVATTLGMISYNKWIQRRVREEEAGVFINATEGGALIDGLRHLSLAQVLDQYLTQTYPVSEIITKIMSGLKS